MASYLYRPLSTTPLEIRIVTLKPGPWAAEIKCEFNHAFIEELPVYEALSYTWGNLNDVRSISLGGFPWNVTANLETALRYLRYPDNPRNIWVDALCINQEDIVEKEEQVRRMRHIYARATTIVSWTGVPSHNSDTAFDVIERLATCFYNAPEAPPIADIAAGDLKRIGFDPTGADWDAVWDFLNRPYWERIWVVQELAAFGTTMQYQRDPEEPEKGVIVCGDRCMPRWMFDFICLLLEVIERSIGFISPQGIEEPRRTMKLRGGTRGSGMFTMLLQFDGPTDGETRNVGKILLRTRSFRATDPHDKIYALLGLMRREDAMDIPVDYSKPVEAVLTDIVKSLIRRDRSLSFLLYNHPESIHNLPSWLPDIYMDDILQSGAGWVDSEQRFSVADGIEPSVEFGEEDKLLIAMGVTVGLIEDVFGPFLPPRLDDDTISTEAENIEKVCKEIGLGTLSPSFKKFAKDLQLHEEDAFWRTLVMDADSTDWSNTIFPAPSKFKHLYRLIFGIEKPPIDFELKEVSKFLTNFAESTCNRCFFRTSNGHMGLGPCRSRCGDVLAALFGASRLLVLRPRGKSYEVIGDAYVQGGMSGEFVKGYLDGRIEPQAFSLY
jgi:hypothetical protein